MQAKTAVVLGATGFIGGYLVQELSSDSAFARIRLLVRRPIEMTLPKTEVVVTKFSDRQDFKEKLGSGDCIFCCVGTTLKQVKGDKDLYRTIDYDIPVHAAELGKAAGFSQYLLVSSVGANAAASNFYLQLKGEVEEKIKSIGFPSLHIFRPSMLMGSRNEFRFGEVLAKGLMQVVSPLLFGDLRKYKGIHGKAVAHAMVYAAKNAKPGIHKYEYDQLTGI